MEFSDKNGVVPSVQNISVPKTLNQDQYFQLYIWASVALPLVCFGAFGNILTLVVIIRAKWYTTGIQVLIVTLTVCGIITTSLVYPVSILGTVVGYGSVWLIPRVCPATGYFFYSVTCMIPMTCAMIAVNRFCMIVLHTRTRWITSRTGGTIMSAISWMISLVVFVFPLFEIDGKFGMIVPLNICIWMQWTASPDFQSGFFLIIYVIPGLIIALCYVGIFLFLRVRRSVNAIKPEIIGRNLRRLIQATKMMGVTFLVYVLCFLPLNVMAWESGDLYAAPYSTIYAWLLLLYFSSDCLHPVIYAAMNQDFSNAYIELLRQCQLFHRKPDLSLKEMVQGEKERYQNFRIREFPAMETGAENWNRLIPRDSVPRDDTVLLHGGAFMDTPNTNKHIQTGSGNQLRYVVGSMQGWRTEMEDTHVARTGLGTPEYAGWSFFAVCDGHAGRQVADYTSQNLLNTIVACTEFHEATSGNRTVREKNDLMHLVFAKSFLTLDLQMRQLPGVANGEERSGSTVISVLIGPETVYFSNLGDSRGIAVSSGSLMVVTEDHKPFRVDEQKRISSAGGHVTMQRINGNLAVSRALGDYDYKNRLDRGPFEQLVSPEPDLYPLPRRTDDEFIVLACDGVWDVINSDEFFRLVRYQLTLTSNLDQICSTLLDVCLGRGSRDNISLAIILFSGAPTPSEEIRLHERQLDHSIERAVCEIVSACPNGTVMDGSSLTHLVSEFLEDHKIKLPEGCGGAKNKRISIEKLWKQMRPDKPLRPDTGEVSTATILKVLANRTLSSRFNFRPFLKNHRSITEQKRTPAASRNSKENFGKPEVVLRFGSPKGDDKDCRKSENLGPVIEQQDEEISRKM